jgi:hypothetical protein
MSKPLPRRAILKALAAAPMAAQEMAQAEIGAVVRDAALTAEAAIHAPPSPWNFGPKTGELAALKKAGLLPDWFTRSLAQQARGFTIDPSVACLRSLSLNAKLRVSADRRYEAALDNLETEFVNHQLRAKFMGWAS